MGKNGYWVLLLIISYKKWIKYSKSRNQIASSIAIDQKILYVCSESRVDYDLLAKIGVGAATARIYSCEIFVCVLFKLSLQT